ncbi:Short transient receptor potential channel 4-associated protein [Gracilariopsis chorda]|uniref:Short transient receptor potential channel 4-associated protein n=1 Tax=Gracilariopsis chorda TaxID=448386 RepID=A0A2V3IZU7_9FLOR|nr:Short transient receptor potential channel 4-associated protein [Gracilariopsis chorda]|eukprot:PXF47671.1 Short transient receptor potential channel 4-associated protein [Gracilariopsis chorda]
MPQRRAPRRVHSVLLPLSPSSVPLSSYPRPLRELRRSRNHILHLLRVCFPPLQTPDVERLHTLAKVITDVAAPLVEAAASQQFIHLVCEAQLPEALSHTLFVAVNANLPDLRHFIVRVLRAFTIFVSASDLICKRFASHNLFPLLFRCMYDRESIELAINLIEELLHERPTLDLSTIPNLADTLLALSPFQLGHACRVLASLVDERTEPSLCGGDCCAGNCLTNSEWRRVEDSAVHLRQRRSYVACARIVRDRNHAVLLSIPALLNRLVKLIFIPPASRDDLVVIDHAARAGSVALAGDYTDFTNDNQALLHIPPHIRQRFAQVFRRGPEADDADLFGTKSWKALDRRIAASFPSSADHRYHRSQLQQQQSYPNGPISDANHLTHTSSPVLSHASPIVDHPHAPASLDAEPVHNDMHGEQPVPEATSENLVQQLLFTHIPPLSDSVSEPSPPPPVVTVDSIVMSAHQIDVLFVLYSLLMGKRKADVQRQLTDMGVFHALNRFCDALDWTTATYETRTEDSLKMHFIRLVHSLCESSDENVLIPRKRLMFSEHERQLLQAMEQGYQLQFAPFPSPASVTCAELPPLERLSLTSTAASAASSSAENMRSLDSNEDRAGPTVAHLFSMYPSISARDAAVSQERAAPEAEPRSLTASPRMKTPPSSAPVTPLSRKSNPAFQQVHDPPEQAGLLTKLALIFMLSKGSDDASRTRRYLLSGCIETFQRSATLCEKTFLARRGLLRYLVVQLATFDGPQAQISVLRQTSFDLLSQLIKWNRSLFHDLNDMFRKDHRLLQNLLHAVSDRLVDSNVFVRSIALSLERFRVEDELARHYGEQADESEMYDFDNCVLWEFIEKYRVRLIHDMISSVRVEDITFENLCCVNTALILFVVSCRDDSAIDAMLSKLADMIIEYAMNCSICEFSVNSILPTDVMGNFAKLVQFWLNYYRYQGSDVSSLEVNTNISFDVFVETAKKLQTRLTDVEERVRLITKNLPALS